MAEQEKAIEKTEEPIISQAQLYPVLAWLRSNGTLFALISGGLTMAGYFYAASFLPGELPMTLIAIGVTLGIWNFVCFKFIAEVGSAVLGIREDTLFVADALDLEEDAPELAQN